MYFVFMLLGACSVLLPKVSEGSRSSLNIAIDCFTSRQKSISKINFWVQRWKWGHDFSRCQDLFGFSIICWGWSLSPFQWIPPKITMLKLNWLHCCLLKLSICLCVKFCYFHLLLRCLHDVVFKASTIEEATHVYRPNSVQNYTHSRWLTRLHFTAYHL